MLINSNIDSSFTYAKKIEISNDFVHKAFAKGLISYLYQLQGDTIKSGRYYQQALDFVIKCPDSYRKVQLKSYILNYRGLTNWKRNNLEAAIQNYLEGKKLSEKIRDEKQVIKFNNNIFLVNIELGKFKEVIDALNQ